MSKQPFPYKERLPLSVHYRDLQASSMGHLFYTHGNPTPEFIKDSTLKKDMHTSKLYSSRNDSHQAEGYLEFHKSIQF